MVLHSFNHSSAFLLSMKSAFPAGTPVIHGPIWRCPHPIAFYPIPLPRTFRVTDEPTCGTAKLQLSCISCLAHALSKYTLHLPFTRRGPAVLWVSSRRLCFELCKRGTGRRRPEGQSQLRRSSSESGGRGLQDWRAGTGRTAEQFLHGADDICLSMWMSSYIV